MKKKIAITLDEEILEKLKQQLKMHKYLLKYRKNMVLFLNIYGLIQMIKLFMKKKKMKQRVRYQIKFLRI